MVDKPQPHKRGTVQLPRHSEPRDVIVKAVYDNERTAMVEYPNTTSRMTLMGDMRERVEWQYIEQ